MINIKEISKKNRETFYNYETGEKVSTFKLNILKIIIILFLFFSFNDLSIGLVNVVLITYAILLGFSFNIMFCIVAIYKEKKIDEILSLENKIKIERLENLTEEIFYNISYFTLISIFLIIISFLFFMDYENLYNFIRNIGFNRSTLKGILLIEFLYVLIFYILLVESFYTFIRITGRVSFFFNEKIKSQFDGI